MQVADTLSQLSLRATRSHAAYTSVELRRTTSTTITLPDPMSDGAAWAMSYIAQSTRLSGDDKRTLTRLVALVDQYAGGDLKLMKAIVGIAKLMEARNPEGTYKSHSFKEVADFYWEERKKMGAQTDLEISVSTEISLVAVEHGATQEEITAQFQSETSTKEQ